MSRRYRRALDLVVQWTRPAVGACSSSSLVGSWKCHTPHPDPSQLQPCMLFTWVLQHVPWCLNENQSCPNHWGHPAGIPALPLNGPRFLILGLPITFGISFAVPIGCIFCCALLG